MSIYCIGDLHGRYDLFIMALEKINFDNEKDKMYILGDIIDGNYGAIQIFKYIMKYPNSFEFILGNHEMQFKGMIHVYDKFMLDDGIKQKFKDVMDYYFGAYDEIAELVVNKMGKKDISLIKNHKKIIKWLKPSKKRSLLLDAILNLVEYLNFDKEEFKDLERVLFSTNGMFRTKQFVKELLEIESKEYLELKKYIFSKKDEIKFTYLKKEFWVTHCLPTYTKYLRHIPDMETLNKYVIFGHEPVPSIHRNLSSYNFDFNFREVLSYIDRFDNHYFNLDMGDNFAAVLRLDDFEEFYVMKYKKEIVPNVVPPVESVTTRKVGFKIVDSCLPVYSSKKGFSFITYRDYCMEYLIGVNKFKKKILYKRVDHMDWQNVIVIENWYDNQTIEEIIDKVNDDYNSRKDTEEMLSIEKLLRKI